MFKIGARVEFHLFPESNLEAYDSGIVCGLRENGRCLVKFDSDGKTIETHIMYLRLVKVKNNHPYTNIFK